MTAMVRGFSFVGTASMVRMSSGSFIVIGCPEDEFTCASAEQAAEDDEFAEVVGVVVGDEEGFAEEVLAVAPAEGFEEIGLRVFDERDEGLEICVNDVRWSGPRRRRWGARGIVASSPAANAWGGSRRWVARRS